MNLPIRPLGDYWQLLQKHGLLSSAQPLSADLLSRPVALVSCDSQLVTPGTLFIVKGAHFKGRYLADALARDLNCRALVTGESLGQVASQTMDALAVSGDVTDLPILRPVIGMDKEEIVRIARHIGTFETSILPYEDCCTVFTPRHPKTRPHVEEVREMEQALDVEGLVRRAMDGREVVKLR